MADLVLAEPPSPEGNHSIVIIACKFALTLPEQTVVNSVSLVAASTSLIGAAFMLVCYLLIYGSLDPAPVSKSKRSIIKVHINITI